MADGAGGTFQAVEDFAGTQRPVHPERFSFRRAQLHPWLALLAFDAAVKLLRVPAAVEGTAQLGYPPEALPIIGVLALVCLVLYVIPRTAPLGAILWTGYFGGTVATHLRAGNPLLTHILSGVYVATLVWVGLYLRDERVKGLLRK